MRCFQLAQPRMFFPAAACKWNSSAQRRPGRPERQSLGMTPFLCFDLKPQRGDETSQMANSKKIKFVCPIDAGILLSFSTCPLLVGSLGHCLGNTGPSNWSAAGEVPSDLIFGLQARAGERHSDGILKIKAFELASIQSSSPKNSPAGFAVTIGGMLASRSARRPPHADNRVSSGVWAGGPL